MAGGERTPESLKLAVSLWLMIAPWLAAVGFYAEARFDKLKLKRVTYAEVVIEAESAAAARLQVEDEGPHDWFVTSDSIGTDTTTIVSVKRNNDG